MNQPSNIQTAQEEPPDDLIVEKIMAKERGSPTVTLLTKSIIHHKILNKLWMIPGNAWTFYVHTVKHMAIRRLNVIAWPFCSYRKTIVRKWMS